MGSVLGGPAGRCPNVAVAVVVAADGAAYLMSDDERTVYGLDPSGQVMAGWPYRAELWLQWQGRCPEDVTGCGVGLSIPAVGPGDVLYLPLAGEARGDRPGR